MTKEEKSKLQKEILNEVKVGQSGRLILAPRIGKTKIIIDLIKRDNIRGRIVWVTLTKKLAEENIPSEFIKWLAEEYLVDLEFVTWRSLHKLEGECRLLIGDEDQHMTAKNSVNLLKGKLKPEQIITMTGTESKSKSKLDLYRRLKLNIIHKISINDAVDIGLLANYKINVIEVEMDNHKNIEVKFKDKKTKKGKSFKTSEASQYEYLSNKIDKHKTKFSLIHRRSIIGKSKSKVGAAKYIFNSLEGRRLIFTTNQEQAEEISQYYYHGGTDDVNLKKFINGDINKIAMVNKGGTGETYKAIDHLIMTQIDSDTNGLTSQKIARTLLEQGEYEATIWILCLKGTQDEVWLQSVLSSFDMNKVEFINYKNLVL